MDVALLHNAKAGDETLSRTELLGVLKRAGFRAKYFSLKDALDDPAALHHGEFVVVAGGDGSVRKVALKLVDTGRPLAVLPLGTANNIAHSLGLEGDPRKIVAGWKKSQLRRIDIGVARGPWGKQRFIEGVGLGLIERAIAIIEDIDEVASRAFASREEKLHRDACVMAALAHEMSAVKVRVRTAQKHWREDYLLFEVMNIRRAGPALEISASANPGDGWFELVSASEKERSKLTRAIEKCVTDECARPILKAKKVRRIRLKVGRCEVRLDDDVVLQRDDAIWKRRSHVRIDIDIMPGALQVLLPG